MTLDEHVDYTTTIDEFLEERGADERLERDQVECITYVCHSSSNLPDLSRK